MHKSRKQINLERRSERNSERGKRGNESKRMRMREESVDAKVIGKMETSGIFGEHIIELVDYGSIDGFVWLRVD